MRRNLWAGLLLLWAPVASAAVSPPNSAVCTVEMPDLPFLNENAAAKVHFDAVGPGSMYVPVVEMFLAPGVSINSAAFALGGAMQVYQLSGLQPGGTYKNPVNKVVETVPANVAANANYVLLRFPLSGMTASMGEMVTTFNVKATAPDAPAGAPLTVPTRCLFALGTDALNNPDVDPPDVTRTSVSPDPGFTPGVVRLLHSRSIDHTATGPHFPVTFLIEAQVAQGEQVNDLEVTGVVPDNFQLVSATVHSGAVASGGALNSPAAIPALPGASIDASWTQIVGSGGTDASIVLQGYIPQTDAQGSAILSLDGTPVNGVGVTNRATLQQYVYNGNTLTPAQNANAVVGAHAVLVREAISPNPSVPGNTLTFTDQVAVSDYFSLDTSNSLVATLGAGVNYNAGSAQLSCPTGTSALSETLGPNLSPPWAALGTAQDIAFSLPSLDGNPSASSGPPPLSPVGPATNCNLTYTAEVQQSYPNGDVVRGADVIFTRQALSTAMDDPAHTLLTQDETNSARNANVVIRNVTLQKALVAVDGNTSLPDRLQPGQVATWRLTVTMPSGDANGLTLTDYLPSPMFVAENPNQLGADLAPLSNLAIGDWPLEIRLCDTSNPLCSTGTSAGIDRANARLTVSQHTADNSLTFSFPAFSTTSAQSVELLIDYTVTNRPADDNLTFTNLAQALLQGTTTYSASAVSVAAFSQGEPKLVLSKAVVASTNPNSQAEGMPPSVMAPYYTSLELANNPLQGNVTVVDAGDRLSVVAVVENRGHAPAYQVSAKDLLSLVDPGANLATPSTGLNLQVRYGDGGVAGATGDLFSAAGLSLVDPIPACASFLGAACVDASGSNLVVLQFELTVADNVKAYRRAPATGTYDSELLAFTNGPSAQSPNFVADPNTTSAGFMMLATGAMSVSTTVTQVRDATDTDTGSVTTAAVADRVAYTTTLTLPETTHDGVTVTATLPAGLLYADAVATPSVVTLGPDLSATTPNPAPSQSGQTLTWSLGTLSPTNTSLGAGTRTLTLAFTAVVANIASNTAGVTLAPAMAAADTDASATVTAAPSIALREPSVDVTLGQSSSTGDAGDTVSFSASIAPGAASHSPIYGLRYTLSVPSAFSSVGNLSAVSGCDGTVDVQSASPGLVTVNCTRKDNNGTPLAFSFDATVGSGFVMGTQLAMTPLVTWSSQPAGGTAASSAGDTPRTGAVGSALNDYYVNDKVYSYALNSVTFVKTLVQSPSGDANARIGDTLVYEVAAQIPEGTSNLQFTDTLPAGMVFVRSDYVANSIAGGSLTCSGDPTCSGKVSGVVGAPTSITQSGQSVSFDLGAVTNDNSTSGTVAGTLTFRITARVANLASNKTSTPSTQLVNQMSLSGNPAAFAAAPVYVADTKLTLATPTVSNPNVDAGDTFAITSTFTNPVVAHAPPAYDILYTMTLPSGLLPQSSGVSYTGCNGETPTPSVSGQAIRFAFSTLPLAGTCSVVYNVKVDGSVAPGQLTNSAKLTWTSTADGCFDNSGACSASPERNGTGGALNTYVATSSVKTNVRAPTVSKSMSTGAGRGIGDTVTYAVTLTVPEGAPGTVTVKDTLPTGLKYVSGQTLSYTNSDSTRLSFASPTPSVSGQTVTWAFGSVSNCTNAASNCAAGANDATVTFSFNAVVDNVASNSASNPALAKNQLCVGAGCTPADVANTQVTVQEPNLIVTQPPTPSSTTPDGGDTITIVSAFRNTPSANPNAAYDITFHMDLPINVTVPAPNPTYVGCDSATPTVVTSASSIDFKFPSLAVSSSCKITYSARVSGSASGTTTVPAGALTWTGQADGCYDNSGTSCAASLERNGTGTGANSYRRALTGFALSTPAPSLQVSMLTAATQPIGGPVTLQFVLTVPEGAQGTAQVTSALPAGLTVTPGQTPTYTASVAKLTYDAPVFTAGATSTWSIGHVVNCTDAGGTCVDGASDATLTWTLLATVDNAQAVRAGVLLPAAKACLGSGCAPTAVAASQVTVVEPSLALGTPTSSVSQFDAGDAFTLTVPWSNATGATVSAAYDTRLRVDLPAGLAADSNVAATAVGCEGDAPRLTASGAQALLDFNRLLPGHSCAVTFTVRADDTVRPGTAVALASTSALTWTSTADGCYDLAGACSISGERNGAGAPLNPYTAAVALGWSVADGSSTAKGFVSASDANVVAFPGLAPGETAVYRIATTFAEGTHPSVLLSDTPPPGLRVLAVAVDPNTPFAGTFTDPTNPHVDAASGALALWDLGDVVVAGDNNSTNNTLALLVTAGVVFDANMVPIAPPGATTNTATFTRGGALVNNASAAVDFVLPVPDISLAISDASPKASSPPVQVTVTFVNHGTGPACDTSVQIAVPAGFTPQNPGSDGLDNDGDGAQDANDLDPGGDGALAGSTLTLPIHGCVAPAGTRTLQALLNVDPALPPSSAILTATLQGYHTLPQADGGMLLDPNSDAQDNNNDGNIDEPSEGSVHFTFNPLAPDLVFSKAYTDQNGGSVLPLDTITYTLTLSNGGTLTATGLVVTDPLPAHMDLLLASEHTTAGTVAIAGGNLIANVGDLPANQNVVITFDMRVKKPLAQATAVSNQAVLTTSDTYGNRLSDDPTTVATDDATVFSTAAGDSDGDSLSDSEERDLGTDPFDADSDDDGVADGAERLAAQDSDGDGVINALDADSDNDGLYDGTELGVTAPVPAPAGVGMKGTDQAAGHYVADADASTTTDPTLADTDGGGVADGLEDVNHNGLLDAGETDPTLGHGADDDARLVADSDGDGLADSEEATAGTDPHDTDSDDDGVPDGAEAQWRDDSDGDGLINALDVDADNDGLFDGTEVGLTAPPHADPLTGPRPSILGTDLTRHLFVADADPSTRSNPLALDTDGGGLRDGAEDVNHNGRLDAADQDRDVLAASDDLAPQPADSDHDGLPDAEERYAGSDPHDADSDDDGVLDGDEPNWSADSDGDGLINALDPDSDNDGLADGLERGIAAPTSADTDLSAQHFVADADPASTTDMLLADSDGGGVADGLEDANHNGQRDSGETDPTAGHGADDASNTTVDSDGDGLADAEELAAGTDPQDNDSDDDGIVDGQEPIWYADSDGDGAINALDADSDNDGILDGTELSATTPVAAGPGVIRGTDLRRALFVADADPLTYTNALRRDTDAGGVRDGWEDANHNGRVDSGETDPTLPHGGDDASANVTDSDQDGLTDAEESAFHSDPHDADTDDDGALDGGESYPFIDSDGDGLLNVLDVDSDDDGLYDGTELAQACSHPDTRVSAGHCMADADPATHTDPRDADTDRGGVGDGAEDLNHNGAQDLGETNPTAGHGADDSPSTVVDSDHDGLPDAEEALAHLDPHDADTDDDGVLDGDEPNWQDDADGDGLINGLDADSDNDGLFDGTELGKDCSHPDTNTRRGQCRADGDAGATQTLSLLADTDRGGVRDGAEDSDHDGVVDAGETDPNLTADDSPAGLLDDDQDGLTNAEEQAAGTDPRDADSDDDGVLDGREPNWDADEDGDGLINALDPDSDDDGLYDGLELGLDCSNPATRAAAHHCRADADPSTTTQPLARDTDHGGVPDGGEDVNANGLQELTETNPNLASDDLASPVADDDHDGLTNAEEVSAGTDPHDADSDDDGVLDGDEPNWRDDTDGDGLINALDFDSDNDGLYDGTELGLDCSHPDTAAAAHHCLADADAGATTTDPLLADTDRGGVRDGAEDLNKNGRFDAGDTDPTLGHGADDDARMLLDGDGDGLTDAEERAFLLDVGDADTDDDGVRDGDEPLWREDSDGDGWINAQDVDSDNDGLLDGTELGVTSPVADTAAQKGTDTGRGVFVKDADPGTTTDPLVADTDHGGVADGHEDLNKNGRQDAGETDATAQSDDASADTTDTDHDGLFDAEERLLQGDFNDPDTDDDGVLDGEEVAWFVDVDGDGLPNVRDPDSDNDGLYDGTEQQRGCGSPGTDVSKHHCIEDADPQAGTSPIVADTDRGGVRDGAEDSDHNGRVDAGEGDPALGKDADDATVSHPDTDGDGLTDAEELACGSDPHDLDSDDDGVADGVEDNWQDDTDGDGAINARDADSDGDRLRDGTERGVTAGVPDPDGAGPLAGTDTASPHFVVDADPSTRTYALVWDTDRGGVADGAEDANQNGRIDPLETNPDYRLDDHSWTRIVPPSVNGVIQGVGVSGGGCSAGPAAASSLAWALAAAACAARSRRRQAKL